jgi:hypothetical protein
MTSIKKGQKYQDRERPDWGFEVLADPNSNGIFMARYRGGFTAELNDCVIDSYYDLVEEVQAPEKPKVGDKYIGNNTKREYRVTAIGETAVLFGFNAYDEDLEMAVNLGDIPKYYTKIEPFFEEGDEWDDHYNWHFTVTSVFRRHGHMYAQVDMDKGDDRRVVLLRELDFEYGTHNNFKKAK